MKKQQASYIRVSAPLPSTMLLYGFYGATHLSRAQFSSSAVKHSNGGGGMCVVWKKKMRWTGAEGSSSREMSVLPEPSVRSP